MQPASISPDCFVGFSELDMPPETSTTVLVHIDFKGKSGSAMKFTLETERGKFPLAIAAPLGELLLPLESPITTEAFEAARAKLSGMHEMSTNVTLASPCDAKKLQLCILSVANVTILGESEDDAVVRAAAYLKRGFEDMALVRVDLLDDAKASVRVHCTDIIFATNMMSALKKAIAK